MQLAWQLTLREYLDQTGVLHDFGPREMPQYAALASLVAKWDWVKAVQYALLGNEPVPAHVVDEMMTQGDYRFPAHRLADYPQHAQAAL